MRTRLLVLVFAGLLLSSCSAAATQSTEPQQSASPSVQDCAAFAAGGPDATGAGALPAVSVECLQGDAQLRLSSLRGPMLIAVWASWCQPCAEEMPLMQQFSTAYGDRVRVLGYALLDETSQAIAGSVNWGVTLPSVEDPDGVYRPDLGVTAPPTTLFIDAEGRIVHRKLGAMKSLAEIKQLVEQYLPVTL